MSKLEEQISLFFDGYTQETYLLACSGGIDSMVLLTCLQRLGIPFEVAHVNYRLRGAESEADRLFTEQHCKTAGIPCHVYQVSDAERDALQNGNLQEKARDIRYRYFDEVLRTRGLRALLTAHHADDQIETFFMHLARKSGLAGLGGMSPRNGQTWRPMLHIRKSEIRAFAAEQRVPYRTDSSNSSTNYTRNRLRQVILPFLKEQGAFPDESILLLSERFRETHTALELNVSVTVKRFLENGVLPFSDWDDLTEAGQYEFARQLGWRARTVGELRKLRRSVQKATFTYVVRENRRRKLYRQENEFMLEQEAPRYVLEVEHVHELPEHFDAHTAYLDGKKLSGELRVRERRTGDRMTPVGMRGSKLLSAILKDAKVPAAVRNSIPLVCDDEKIVWLPGYRVSAEAAARDEQAEIVRVRLQQNS